MSILSAGMIVAAIILGWLFFHQHVTTTVSVVATPRVTDTPAPTATPQPMAPTATPQPASTLGIYPFSADVPAPDCTGNNSGPVLGLWDKNLNPGTVTNCLGKEKGVLLTTTAPVQQIDRLLFAGVNVQAHPFPSHYQVNVNVDLSSAQNACVGFMVRPYQAVGGSSYGPLSQGYYLCNGGAAGTKTCKSVTYDNSGVATVKQTVALTEGTKTTPSYGLQVSITGTQNKFDVDTSACTLTLPDQQQGGSEYVALAFDVTGITAAETDSATFSSFVFAPLP